MRFCRMSTAIVNSSAFELTIPCSQGNGGASRAYHPRLVAHAFTPAHRQINETTATKYAVLPQNALMRSIAVCQREIMAASLSEKSATATMLSRVAVEA